MTRLAIIYSRGSAGLDAPLVSVEVHISRGLPRLSIVGLPEAAVRESKDRVRSAILNSKFEFPTRRITINLAPADLPKDGGRFDLPIALGILAASEQIPMHQMQEYEFGGELALSGDLRAFKGVLPFALATRKIKRKLIIAEENAFEAGLAQDNIIYPAKTLLEVCRHLQNKSILPAYTYKEVQQDDAHAALDMCDIQGQHLAKRALEIAAAGRHSILIFGPPGAGKTMLASRLPTIMPNLTNEEALQVAAIHSLIQRNILPIKWRVRPFRTPHHTASTVAMVGGGVPTQPGEISLAHHGVLFLDEFPEYDRKVLESIREPLEQGSIVISRAARKTKFPAQFQLVAAMNPCPCGQYGNLQKPCHCTADQILKYQSKISGPLMDRIDLYIDVPAVNADILTAVQPTISETSAQIKARIQKATDIQLARSKCANSLLCNTQISKFCILTRETRHILKTAIEKLNLSARGYYRVLKVARTIADLQQDEIIDPHHITEALSFRPRVNTKA